MKISKSRKSTHSVMNNEGFGLLTITIEGVVINIPEEWLFKNGQIKKYAIKRVNAMVAKGKAFNEYCDKTYEV